MNNNKFLVANKDDKSANHRAQQQHENNEAAHNNGGVGEGEGRVNSEEYESRINENVNQYEGGFHVLVEYDDHDHEHNHNNNSAQPKCSQPRQHWNSAHWDKFLPFRSLKILLVESDDSTRLIVCALLQNCGYEVQAVGNSKQAWKVLEDATTNFDLVLSELVSPCFSGIDSRGVVFKCLSKEEVDFLVEPIRKNELKNLWQHVRRKYQVSSCASGSESGIWIEKLMKSSVDEDSESNNGSNNEDDNGSIGLDYRNKSGCGTQSSWTTRAVDVDSPQPMSPQNEFADSSESNCVPIKEIFGNNWANERERKTLVVQEEDPVKLLDKKFMGKDLRIGICSTPSPQLEDGGENGLTNTKAKYSEPNSSKDYKNFEIQVLDLNKGQPDEESANYRTEKDIHEKTGILFFDLIRKRPREVQDNGANPHFSCQTVILPKVKGKSKNKSYSFNHLSRYNSGSTDIQPDSNQCSNGSSNNNGMGSTTNDAFTQQVSLAYKPSAKIQGSWESGSSKATRAAMDGNPSAQSVQRTLGSKHGISKRNTAGSSSRAKKSEKGTGQSGTGGNGDDENRFALREAVLNRFRQKRQERCFERKVRYESRKTLAEQRPRIRGQFIRKGLHENKGKGIDYKPDPITLGDHLRFLDPEIDI